MKSEHEKALIKVMELLELAGWRVVRLDKRTIPDLIAVSNKKIVAIEVETALTSVYVKETNYKGSPFYDEVYIVKPSIKKRLGSSIYFTQDEYDEAVKLRKEGKTLTQIRELMGKKFGRKPSMGTLHKWFSGEIDEERIERVSSIV